MATLLRQAERADVAAIFRVRYAVKENRIAPGILSEEDVTAEMEVSGKGWVIEEDGRVVAFAIGNALTGNIWALFVDPEFEGRGFGRRLHDQMLSWLQSRGLHRLWLTTDPGTRAQRFYERSGWRNCGLVAGELRFEMSLVA